MIYILDLESKNTWTSLLDSDWFYDISTLDLKSTQTTLLDLELKYSWTKLVDSDWFYYNQGGLLLELYENLLELSVKQLVLNSNLANPIFLWCVKNEKLMKIIATLCIFLIQQQLSKSKSI